MQGDVEVRGQSKAVLHVCRNAVLAQVTPRAVVSAHGPLSSQLNALQM